MERDYKAISGSLLFCIQTLTNEIDKANADNAKLKTEVKNLTIDSIDFDQLNKNYQYNLDNAIQRDKCYLSLETKYFELDTKYNNALAMIDELTKSKSSTESITAQEELNLSIDKTKKESYVVDPNHFKQHPSRRKLTTLEAQDVYDSYVNKGKTKQSLAKHFNVAQSTIYQIINGTSYKEINRDK